MSFSSSVFALWLLGASVLLWHDVGVLGQAVTPVCVMNACTLADELNLSELDTTVKAAQPGQSLTVSGAVKCADTAPACALKLLDFDSVTTSSTIRVASLEIDAAQSVTVSGALDVSGLSADVYADGAAGGAAHGGDGAGQNKTAPGQSSHGSPVKVATKGKAGPGTAETGKCLGGGFLKLSSKKIAVNSKLSANALDGGATCAGGSGGGVAITAADSFTAGAGFAVEAKGGAGTLGPGGGGRVAIRYGSGTKPDAKKITVVGGAAQGADQLAGGVGTVFLEATNTSELIVAAATGTPASRAPTALFLTPDLSAVVFDVSLSNVALRPDDVDADTIDWKFNGTLTMSSATVRALQVKIDAGGAFRMDVASVIDVSAKVTPAIAAVGMPRRVPANALGVSAADAVASAGGSSHAGIGGPGLKDGNTSQPERPGYGSALQPATFGGPGGAADNASLPTPDPAMPTGPAIVTRARGGGTIYINVEGACVFDGKLIANGESAAVVNGGGAAGGSIWFDCGQSLTGNGTAAARGGAAMGKGGGGGGGRVRFGRDLAKVRAAARRPTGTTGSPSLVPPPLPPPLATIFPIVLSIDVSGGSGYAPPPAGSDGADTLRNGGAGTIVAVLGLQGVRLLVRNRAAQYFPTFVGDGAFSFAEVSQAFLRGDVSATQLALAAGAFIADTNPITLNVAYLRIGASSGVFAEKVTINGVVLEIEENGQIRARGTDRVSNLAPRTAAPGAGNMNAEFNGQDSAEGAGGGGNGGDGANGSGAASVGAGGQGNLAKLSAEAFQPAMFGGAGGSLVRMVDANTTELLSRGGAGGGVVSISLKGAFVCNGTVSVDGESAPQDNAGSGAGGSLYVRARTVSGTGSLSALGGRQRENGGAGGGGRIAIAHQLGVADSLALAVAGGSAGRGLAGAVGTVVLITEGLDSKEAVARRQAHLIVPGESAVGTVINQRPTRLPDVPPSAVATLRRSEPFWTNVTLRNAFVAIASELKTRTFSMSSSAIQQDSILITATDAVTIDKASRLDASDSRKTFDVAPAVRGCGGAHGGHGGANTPTATAFTRGTGSATLPGFGSAGSPVQSIAAGAATKGLGGGRIRLVASSESSTVSIEGSVLANGGAAVASSELTVGGGAGGGILIQGRTIVGSGLVSANGGNGAAGTPAGGPGGGGRVALVDFATLNSSLRVTVNAGAAVMDAMSGTMLAGVGSIYRKSFNSATNVVTIDGGMGVPSPRLSGSDWPATADADYNVEIRGNAHVNAANDLTIVLKGNITMTGGLLSNAKLSITANSVTLSGGARVSASGAGAIKPNPDADTALGASGQIYGAGGGHSSGYGIKQISYAIVAPMNVPFPPVVADDYRKPVEGGLVGGSATPDATIANLTSPTGAMAGGAPGGSVRMLLTGALTVGKDSSVESNGLEPQVTTTLACALGAFRVGCEARKPEVSLVGGGGGGGGSVWIDALSILGDGQITANGGSVMKIRISIAGTPTEVASPGGAGGGGRVALYYRDQLAPTIVARAAGGRSQEFTAYGTAGFVYLKNMRTFAEELVLDNNYDQQQNPWPPTTLPAGAFAALTLRGAAIARAPAAALNVALLTMSAKAQLRAASAFGDLVIRSDEVKLSDGARVAAGVVDISAQRIDITGMTTEVTAAGTASGSPADGASTTMGGGGGGGPQAPGGGCMTVAAGAQSTNGKGGRGGSVMTNLGGNGGGIVRLNAWNQLTFAMSPTVAVSGFPATSAGVFGAGGGGAGTIEVIADKIAGAARFLADGGSTKGTGGGGSGGFVLLKSANLTTLPPSITVVVTGGANDEITECKGNDGQISHDAMVVANRTRFFCRGGTFDSDSQCAQCSPGTAAPAPGATVCADCTAGSFAKNAGSIECTPCAPGSAVNMGKALECALCEIGQQAVAPGAANCTACAPGTFAATRGTAVCAPCAAGQKQPMPGSDKCVPCDEGTATNGTTGATMCAQCAAGQEAPIAGTPKCLECKPGFASAMAGEMCVPCQRGTASLFEASLLCERCPAATFAAAPASATCAPCPPGQASDIDGQVSCSPCEPGTFASEERSRSCAPCGEDQQADAKGKAACDPCPEGTYTECASFVSMETCPAMNCRWRPAEMDCVTVKCTTCATSDKRADCVRWNKFSARKSVLTGPALSCRCAVAKEEVEITLQARTGFGNVWTSGGVNATLTFGGGALAPISPIDRANGSFAFLFTFPAEGNYTITVNANGIDVGESPVTIQVAPAVTVSANVTASLVAEGVPGWAIGVAVAGGVLLLVLVIMLIICASKRTVPTKSPPSVELQPKALASPEFTSARDETVPGNESIVAQSHYARLAVDFRIEESSNNYGEFTAQEAGEQKESHYARTGEDFRVPDSAHYEVIDDTSLALVS